MYGQAHRHGRAASWLLPSFCSSRARARQCADGDGYRPIVRERVPKSAGADPNWVYNSGVDGQLPRCRRAEVHAHLQLE